MDIVNYTPDAPQPEFLTDTDTVNTTLRGHSFHRYQERDQREHENFPYPIHRMRVGNVDTTVTVAKAENPVATIHLLKGFKSSPLIYKNLLDEAVLAGINVVMVTLPDPDDQADFMDDYDAIANAFFNKGELDSMVPENLPVIAATHSTGGFLLTRILMNDEAAATIKDRYASLYNSAAFFGNKHYRGIRRQFSIALSGLNGDTPVGETALEKAVLTLRGIFDSETKDMLQKYKAMKAVVNHKQALYMDAPTRDLLIQSKQSGFPEISTQIPVTFVLLEGDKVSDNTSTKKIANALGADIETMEGTHGTIWRSKRGHHHLIAHVKSTLESMNARPLQTPCQDQRDEIIEMEEEDSNSASPASVSTSPSASAFTLPQLPLALEG